MRQLSAGRKSVRWIAWGHPKQETIDPEGEVGTFTREEEARQYNAPCLFCRGAYPIQEAPVADMCSLHVNDPFDAREESSHQRETTVITPDGDCGDADGDCGDADDDCGDADGADKSDDKDYYPPSQPLPPSSNPAPKQKKKKNDPNPKLILDRSFMKYI